MTSEQEAVLTAARIYGMHWTIQNWRKLTEAITALVEAENPGRCLVSVYMEDSTSEKRACYLTLPCEIHKSNEGR